ncbi:MAG TPA: carbon-phosphorus lyase complex subunit PhnI [Pseudonocardia sp.]|uniref:carbon-phosphorus lyase complex subunit PhnI n=1 Tax=Pseudonocardia sp. TaxID=60912 RepID=UPI002CBC1094|nr:carbon-phosphorus lyase complex subunit PhnI [Pseudonocardia sp.]HTF51335.1 carbon-phosphorus lyase complex subunit PhnI [Pseudonocardia sp.]
MGYSGARGGLQAILAAEGLVRRLRDHAPAPWAPTAQVITRFRLAVDRVMGEAGLYDEGSAAAAFRQAEGDPLEASHLLRAYRSTLPRLAVGEPVDPDELLILRRIVPAFREPEGPQLLGRTTDYTGRLLEKPAGPPGENGQARTNGHDTNGHPAPGTPATNGTRAADGAHRRPRRFLDLLRELDLAVDHRDGSDPEPFDITRSPARPPAPRSAALAAMARAETGALVALWYRSILGPDGNLHEVTLGEVRHGRLPLRVRHPHTGNPVTIGEFRVTEAEAIEDLDGAEEDRARFDVGYGLCFGHNERKAIAMANLDIANRRFGATGPLEQLLLLTTDGLDSGGFLEHLKLPHYVTFRSMVERKQALQAAQRAGVEDVEARLPEPVGRVC